MNTQKLRAALACFTAAQVLSGDGGHGAVAAENAQIIRDRTCGFLSLPLATLKVFFLLAVGWLRLVGSLKL